MAELSEPPLLAMRGVHKRFGAVVALDGVELLVAPGEVHALVGENGAGKSTLMKVLSGAHAPDAGSMELSGEAFAPRGPLEARARGVSMIYQELSLAPDLSVAENIMLGRERSRFGLVARGAMREQVQRALDLLEHPEIRPDRKVAELGPGARQLVELARAVVPGERHGASEGARVVVMDEPTSSLTRDDTERLFAVIGRLRAQGASVIYISHFLEEVERVADRYTVLRDGRTVATGRVRDASRAAIVEAMVGRKLDEAFPRVAHQPGAVSLRVEGLSGRALPKEASFELRRGEIFGIAGLVGAGRTELLRTIFGLDPVRSGRVTIAALAGAGHSPRERLAAGVGLLSERRKEEGLAVELSIADNLTLSRLGTCARAGVLDRGRQRAITQRWVERLSVRCRDVDDPVASLSGGNQQKIALGRLLHHDVDVLLLDEPTRGVDVGSKAEIYRLMGELAAAGKAVLMVSSYLPELMGVCDRIAVMHRGRLSPARPVAEWTEAEVMEAATVGMPSAGAREVADG